MTKFEEELKKNSLVCSECKKCKRIVWPPSDFCNRCFGNVIWRPLSRVAKLIEFSRKGEEYFCIAEFEESVRVMGAIEKASNPQVGQSLVLVKCDFNGKERFVFKTKN